MDVRVMYGLCAGLARLLREECTDYYLEDFL
ncbi:hypothetical protein OKW41_006201 [Paraburkholderia sp. UCT70]